MPRPWSRSFSMRSRTCAVWATPSAAVGSSNMTTRGRPSRERAIAMICRCPPDNDATGTRRSGMSTEREDRSSQARRSISTASRVPGQWSGVCQSACSVDVLVAEEEVLDDVEIVAKGAGLVDGGDTQTLCVCGVGDVALFAVPGDDTTVVGGVCPGDHLDEGRFSGTVVTE